LRIGERRLYKKSVYGMLLALLILSPLIPVLTMQQAQTSETINLGAGEKTSPTDDTAATTSKTHTVIPEQEPSQYAIAPRYLPRPPEPEAVLQQVKVAAYYIPGWARTRWELGCSQFKPILEGYGSADPAVADWHIKWALEHGIDTFIIILTHPSAVGQSQYETGLMKSRFFERIQYAVDFNAEPYFPGNSYGNDPEELDDLVTETMTYLAKYCFDMPNYLRVGDRPVVFLYHLWIHQAFAGAEKTRALVQSVREVAAKYGYDIFLVGDMMYPVHVYGMEPAVEGLDGITSYCEVEVGKPWGRDSEGRPYLVYSYDTFVSASLQEMQYWSNLANRKGLSFIPPLNPGFSDSLMQEKGINEWLFELANPTIDGFRRLCEGSKSYVNTALNMVIAEAWNEFEEGSVIEPTEENGFAYLDVLKECFALRPEQGWPRNLIPHEENIYAELVNETLVQSPPDYVLDIYTKILEEKCLEIHSYDVNLQEISDSISLVSRKIEEGKSTEAVLLAKSVDEELNTIIYPKILFDESYDEYQSISDEQASKIASEFGDAPGFHSFSEFASLLQDARCIADRLTSGGITFDILREYDALVVACPLTSFSKDETSSIGKFVQRGGGLLLIGDGSINSAINSLAKSVGLTFLLGAVIMPAKAEDKGTFFTSNIIEHPITHRHSSVYINWGCALNVSESWQVIMRTANYTGFMGNTRTEGLPFLATANYGDGRLAAIADQANFWRSAFCADIPISIDIANWLTQTGGPYTSTLAPALVLTASKTIVGQGLPVTVNATVENQGASTKSFNVTLYANTSVLNSQIIALEGGNSTIVMALWNTTGFDVGNYTLSVVAGLATGETHTADNTFVGDSVFVSIVGDVNADDRVDMKDVSYVARRFMCVPSDALWDPVADVNSDGKIDMKDISTVTRHFGEHYP